MANYPENMVAPYRLDLTSAGFKQLMTATEVENEIQSSKGTTLLCINSVCGCAAGKARPAIKEAISHTKKPDKLLTVFAGMETEAVAKAREYMKPYPPSSPSIALFKDGKLVHMVERRNIEMNELPTLIDHLKATFEEYC